MGVGLGRTVASFPQVEALVRQIASEGRGAGSRAETDVASVGHRTVGGVEQERATVPGHASLVGQDAIDAKIRHGWN